MIAVQAVLWDQRETLCALFLGEHLWAEMRGEVDRAAVAQDRAQLVQSAIARHYEAAE